MDETQPITPPTRVAPSAKRKRAKHAARPQKAAPAQNNTLLIAVYIVLGALVIGTSFYTGYLVGLGSDGPTTVKGSGEQLLIVEYSDFQCPFCSRAAPTIEQLKQAYGDKIRIEYKQFPLESLHPDAFNAAVAAECVRKEEGEDAFWSYHDALFANQDDLSATALKQYAKDLGYDIGSCLDGQETASTVRAHMAEATAAGIRGTPSFLIGGELVVGALPFETLAAKVDEKLAGGTAAPVAPTQPTAPAAPAAPEARVDVDGGTYTLGDADAPVLIVEFTDFECPFCGRAHTQTYPQIKSEYIDTGKVQYTLRHFPLSFHPNAHKAAEAAECAGKLGGSDAFWEYSETLFANQGDLVVTSLKRYAQEQGLDATAFATCLDSGEFAAKVDADAAAGGQAGVSGTPSFFVNGQKVVGAQPYNVFKAAIDAELQ